MASIGIDIGKEVFHVIGFGTDGKIAFRHKIDAKGDTAKITIPNVNQSNGVIQVIDTVLMPAS